MENQFGWNLFTVSYIATIIFTLLQAWGFWRQYKAIESGRSVPVPIFLYGAFVFFATFIYGMEIQNRVLAFNGFGLLLMQFPILMRLYESKGFSKFDRRFLVVLMLALTAMIFAPGKDIFFLVFSFGAVAMLTGQPWAIWKNKDAGDVEVRMILMCLGSTIFWTYYAFRIHEWTLQILCPSYMAIWTVTGLLWLKYKKRQIKGRKLMNA